MTETSSRRKRIPGLDFWSPRNRDRLLAEIEADDYMEEEEYLKYLTELTERRCRFSLRRVFQRLLEIRNQGRELISSASDLCKDYQILYAHLSKVTTDASKFRADLEDMWYLDHIIECLGRQEPSIALVPYRIEDC